jgi:hypothetical protein
MLAFGGVMVSMLAFGGVMVSMLALGGVMVSMLALGAVNFGFKSQSKICSCHDIAEIMLSLALNTNQSTSRVKPTNITLLFAASLLSTQH